MVAIVSGASLGLGLTSKSVLGEQQGVAGDPSLGQGGANASAYVNVATGNLVLQQLQDTLVGPGPELDTVLTYNSLGLRNDDNGDNFTLGVVPAQIALSGTRGQAGSTLTITEFDGARDVYTWDATAGVYASTAGGGARDTITYSAATNLYTVVDGTTQATETYDATSGQLKSRTDAQGHAITFQYAGALLSLVSSAVTVNGKSVAETVGYTYSGTQLSSITTTTCAQDAAGNPVLDANGNPTFTTHSVSYGYTSNRPTTVQVDVTPPGGPTSTFTTAYGYDSSGRVTTVKQNNVLVLTVTYDATTGRVATTTDGDGNVTTFSYVTSTKTDVTTGNAATGFQKTSYAYDAATGQLLSVTAPALADGTTPTTTYTYDPSGNVASITSVAGGVTRTVTLAYDANGNLASRLDADGDLTLYTYDGKNRLLTQTTSTLATPAMTNLTGVSATAGTLIKTGTNNLWDASAYSASGIAGGAAVSFTAAQATAGIVVGLTATPAGAGLPSAGWAIYCNSNGTLSVYENGVTTALAGTSYKAGDTLSVRYDGSTVSYWQNGNRLRTVGASSDDALYVFTTFRDPNGRIDNLRFGEAANDGTGEVELQAPPVLSSTTGVMAVVGDSATKTGGTSGWDGSAWSNVGLAGGASVSFTATSTSKFVMVGLDANPGADAGTGSMDFAAYLRPDAKGAASLHAYMNGAGIPGLPDNGSLCSFSAGDRISLSYDGANTVSWLKNGQVVGHVTLGAALTQALYVDSSFSTAGGSVRGLRFGGFGAVDPLTPTKPPVMANAGGVAISGGTLTKTGGADGQWDSSARSALGLSGGAEVGFTVASAGKALSIGLNSDPDTSVSYTSTDYAFVLGTDYSLQVWIAGSRVGITLPNYAVGDRLMVRSDGVHATWSVNGSVVYTSNLLDTGLKPLYVDAAFSSSGAQVTDLLFDGGDPVAQAGTLAVPRLTNTTSALGTGSLLTNGTLSKTGSADGTWDAAGRSTVGIAGGASLAFTTVTTNGNYAVGLTTSTTPGADPAAMTYAVRVNADGTFGAWQGGTLLQTLGTYAQGDRLGLVYDGNNVRWLRNGKNVYSLTATVAAPLYLDTTFASTGAKLSHLGFGSSDMADPLGDGDAPVLNALGGVTVLGGDVTKTSGAAGTFDASVHSTYGIVGDATMSFTAETPGAQLVAGLDINASASTDWKTIAYGFNLLPNGTLQVVESGTSTPLTGLKYTLGDRFSVSYDGRQVVYVMNGQVLRSTAATVATSLHASVCLAGLGAKASDLSFTGGVSSDQTTRYVYDDAGKGLLRYVITAAGRVTEYAYNGSAQLVSTFAYAQANYSMVGLAASGVPSEASMNAWRAMQDLSVVERTNYTRDWRGQLSAATVYSANDATGQGLSNGTVTTRYVYDAAGRLLSRSQGNAYEHYVYDGLGRLVSQTDDLLRTTKIDYTTVFGQVKTSVSFNGQAAQQVVTQTFNREGWLISSVDSSAGVTAGETDYAYDPNGRLLRTTDPTGLKTWCLYDADGRKIADIDGAGDVTEYDYDASGLVTRTVRHGSALSAADLATLDGLGNPSLAAIHVSYSAASDRASWNVYDTAGRLRQTIDARGAVVQYDYDGAGRVVATTAFANRVDTSHFGVAPSFVNITASTSPSTSQADRVTRNYYDEDGLLVGVLDADNYLTTYQHDADGRVTVTTRYATQIASVGVESTLAEILPAPAVDDQRSVTLYDLAGRVAGTVDAEGYLTENTYDKTSGDLLSQTRYATQVGSAVDPRSAVSGLRPADDPNDQVTSFTYDSHHRVTQQTGPDGTVTQYGYSKTGDQLLSTDIAPFKADERLVTQTLDGDGRVIDAASGIGGHTTTVYDAAGRLLRTTDAAGRITRYFYDDAGRLRYTVAATADATTTAAPGTVPGAVTEVQYDAFGQVTRTLRYLKTVDLASIGTGCVISKLASNPFTALTGTTAATRTTSYLVSGLVNAVTDEAGYATTTADADYDAFGDVLSRTSALAGGVTRTDLFTYDHRGNLLTSEVDHGGLGVKTSAVYDAFGRQVQATDALGNVTTTAYDHRGNVIQRTDPLNPASTWTYDAFDRVLSASIAGADPTTYAYDRAARTTTVTPPGLAPTVTAYDDQGRVSTVTDGNGHVTTTTYDADGHVTGVSVDGTATYAARYDAAGRLVTSQDGAGIANGVWTHYTYDAANRLQYVVDAAGGVTWHEYDALGREVRTTRFSATMATLPTNSAAIDATKISVATTPGVDQVVKRCYDAAGRVSWECDGAGGVTQFVYGPGSEVLQRVRYYNAIVPSAWTDLSAAPSVSLAPAYDRTERWIYDALGRPTLAVDANGSATATSYDAAGNVLSTRQYAAAVPSGGAMQLTTTGASSVSMTLPETVSDSQLGATVRFKAAAGVNVRLILGTGAGSTSSAWVTGTGGWMTLALPAPYAVTGSHTDVSVTLATQGAGVVTFDDLNVKDQQGKVLYASNFESVAADVAAGVWTAASGASLAQAYVSPASAGSDAALQTFVGTLADAANDRLVRQVHDADGRLVLVVDATGAATETSYDARGNVTLVRRYATPVATTDTGAALLADVHALAGASDLVTRNVYDAANRLVVSVAPGGIATRYTYDNDGNVVQQREYASTLGALNVADVGDSPGAVLALGGASTAGEVVTATLRFKCPAGVYANLFLGASTTDASQGQFAGPGTQGNGGWQVMTVSYTVTQASQPLYLSLFGVNGNTVQFDDLQVTSSLRGVIVQTGFDQLPLGSAAGQWSINTVSSPVNGVDASTDAALLQALDALADGSRDRLTVNKYDGLGRLTDTTDPLGRVTHMAYDASGHLSSRERYAARVAPGADPTTVNTADGLVERYCYDTAGRLTVTSDPRGVLTAITYDGAGNVLTRTQYATTVPGAIPSTLPPSPFNRTTTYTYDGAGRVLYALDPARQVTGYVYDGFGECTKTTQYYTPLPAGSTAAQVTADGVNDLVTTSFYDADGHVVLSTAYSHSASGTDANGNAVSATDAGLRTRYAYDAFGQLAWSVAPDGGLASYAYDAAGRLLRTTRYAAALDAGTLNSLVTRITPAVFATLQATGKIAANAANDRLALNQYDAFGRLRYTMDGARAVTELRYDAAGNVTERIGYAKAVAAWSGTGTPALAAIADPKQDRHVFTSYDAFGDALTQATALGDGNAAFVANTYDAGGQLTARVSYAGRVALANWPVLTAPAADATRDIHELFHYDAYGRLDAQADGTGAVTQLGYDASGNLSTRTQRATQSTLAGGNWWDSASWNIVAPSSDDRLDSWQFDAFGAAIWHVDATGAVTGTSYDLDGRVTSTTQYASAVAPGTQLVTAPAAPTTSDANQTPLANRTTATVYDSFGRTRYVTDPTGAVAMTTYDAHGHVASQVAFADHKTVSTSPTAALLAVDTTRDQKTAYVSDALGRVLQRTDAAGGVQRFTYDGVGNKTTFTDEKGSAWTYAYDAAGREVMETSPAVIVTKTGFGTNHLDLQSVDSTNPLALRRTWTYDAAGDLQTCIEGLIVNADNSIDNSQARTTNYGVDALGRVVSTTRDGVNAYDRSGNLLTSVATTALTTYDVFGNVVARSAQVHSTDANGHDVVDPAVVVGYAAYDQANRLRYAIDAVGDVTGYARNAFGDVTTQTGYAVPISLGGIPSTGPRVSSLTATFNALPHDADRVTTFTVDHAGRTLTRTGMAGYFFDGDGNGYNLGEASVPGLTVAPQTTYAYDVFGELSLEQHLVRADSLHTGSHPIWARTLHYYDGAGRETDTVDPLGYLTHRDFDAFGNAKLVTEYAAAADTTHWVQDFKGKPPAATTTTTLGSTGIDRTIAATYDLLNRKTSETRNVDYLGTDGNTHNGATTSWSYDAQGHVTSSQDALGYTTYRMYDALGQLRATLAPKRYVMQPDGTSAWAAPLVEYSYDALGQQIVRNERAFGAMGTITEFTGAWTAGQGYTSPNASSADRITRTLYDKQGQVTQTDVSVRGVSQNTRQYFDRQGRLVLSSQQNIDASGATLWINHGYVYDAQGRLQHEYLPYFSGAANPATTDYQYNAFGQVTAKGVDVGRTDANNQTIGYQEFFHYDTNGLLWRSNTGDGVWRVTLHDLTGRATATLESEGAGYNNTNLDASTITNAQDAANASDVRSTQTGYDLDGNARHLVQAMRSGSTPIIVQTFDRWGNVLSRSDARNTAWLTRYAYDAANQLVTQNLPDAGSGAQSDKSTTYAYDRCGNRVAMTDENGNSTNWRYDAGGYVIETDQHPTQTSTVKTTRLYDTFGRLRQSVSGNGYVSGNDVLDYTTTYTYAGFTDLATSVQHGMGSGGSSTQSYSYDDDGNRLTSFDGAVTTTYAYDAAGHVTKVTLPQAAGTSSAPVTSYTYDDAGHQSSETDADNNTAKWTYDYFGTRTLAHTDFSGHTAYTSTYDNAGQLTRQTSTGRQDNAGNPLTNQNQSFSYDEAGQLTQLSDAGAGTTSTYTYTLDGQHATERTVANGVNAQNNKITYDKRGRMISAVDDNVIMTVDYDAVGNRTHVGLYLSEAGGLLASGQASPGQSDRYFSYDGMNRQLHMNWQSDTDAGQLGHTLAYDADSNRITDRYNTGVYVKLLSTQAATTSGTGPDGRGIFNNWDALSKTSTYWETSAPVTEAFSYDNQDRLTRALVTANTVVGDVDTQGWLVIDQRSYDAAGRVTSEYANLPGADSHGLSFMDALNANVGVPNPIQLDSDKAKSLTYDEDGRVKTITSSTPSVQESTSYSYDAEGNVVRTSLSTTQYGATTNNGTTDDTTFTVVAAESYETTAKHSVQQTWAQGVGSSDKVYQSPVNRDSATTYDPNGRIQKVTNDTMAEQDYVNDAQGHVLTNTETGTGSAQLRDFVVNGASLGQYGNDVSAWEAAYQQTARFDFGYQTMESAATQTGTSTITAQEGETLQELAAAAYGDSQQWQRIAMMNGLSGGTRLHRGERLTLAGIPGGLHNAAHTFAAEDPSAMIGITVPRLTPQQQATGTGANDPLFYDPFEQYIVYNRQLGPGQMELIPHSPLNSPFGMDEWSDFGRDKEQDEPNLAQQDFRLSEIAQENSTSSLDSMGSMDGPSDFESSTDFLPVTADTRGSMTTIYVGGTAVTQVDGVTAVDRYGNYTYGDTAQQAFQSSEHAGDAGNAADAYANAAETGFQASFGDHNTTSVGELSGGNSPYGTQGTDGHFSGGSLGNAGGGAYAGAEDSWPSTPNQNTDPAEFAALDAMNPVSPFEADMYARRAADIVNPSTPTISNGARPGNQSGASVPYDPTIGMPSLDWYQTPGESTHQGPGYLGWKTFNQYGWVATQQGTSVLGRINVSQYRSQDTPPGLVPSVYGPTMNAYSEVTGKGYYALPDANGVYSFFTEDPEHPIPSLESLKNSSIAEGISRAPGVVKDSIVELGNIVHDIESPDLINGPRSHLMQSVYSGTFSLDQTAGSIVQHSIFGIMANLAEQSPTSLREAGTDIGVSTTMLVGPEAGLLTGRGLRAGFNTFRATELGQTLDSINVGLKWVDMTGGGPGVAAGGGLFVQKLPTLTFTWSDAGYLAHELDSFEPGFVSTGSASISQIDRDLSPFVTRYDPAFPGRPDPQFSIDSMDFQNPKGFNAAGYPRDSGEFWRIWSDQNPESLSDNNLFRIQNLGLSPEVDLAWINAFPEHANYLGDVLIHHHVDFGRFTMPVPGSTHPGSGGTWHL